MAHSDLIIMAFEQKEDALLARKALEIMRDRHLFGLEHAAEITCDERRPHGAAPSLGAATHPHGTRRHLTLMLSTAMFDLNAEGQRPKLPHAGLDEFFLEEVMQSLAPNSSALLIYVPHNSTADTRALLKHACALPGTVHRTTVSPEAEHILFNGGL